MINYQQFLKIIHSGKSKQAKFNRRQLKDVFFTKKGPGAKFRQDADKFNKMITIPKYLQELYQKMEGKN